MIGSGDNSQTTIPTTSLAHARSAKSRTRGRGSGTSAASVEAKPDVVSHRPSELGGPEELAATGPSIQVRNMASGTSAIYWTITCPRCRAVCDCDATSCDEENISNSSLGSGEGLGGSEGLLPEGGHKGFGTMDAWQGPWQGLPKRFAPSGRGRYPGYRAQGYRRAGPCDVRQGIQGVGGIGTVGPQAKEPRKAGCAFRGTDGDGED